MQNVTVTRMDLLARKQQIELAEQGRDYIERSLDERERAEHFRLKRVKKAREKASTH